jgi:outer membrane protein assembly factor BamB
MLTRTGSEKGAIRMKRKPQFMLAAGIMVIYMSTVLIGLCQLQDGPWPKFHRDLKNTGHSPYVGPNTGAIKWTYATGDVILSSPAVGSDGTIYVGSADNKLYAFKPNGNILWSYVLLVKM